MGQANALNRATAVLAAIFFTTSIALTLLAGWNRTPASILGGPGPAPISLPGSPAAPPPGGTVLDQLKAREAPAAPAAPAAPEVPKSQ